jgi:hypothetical protein
MLRRSRPVFALEVCLPHGLSYSALAHITRLRCDACTLMFRDNWPTTLKWYDLDISSSSFLRVFGWDSSEV